MRQSVDEFAAPPGRIRTRERDKKMRNAHARDPVLRVKFPGVFRKTGEVSLKRLLAEKGVRTVFHCPRELSSLSRLGFPRRLV